MRKIRKKNENLKKIRYFIKIKNKISKIEIKITKIKKIVIEIITKINSKNEIVIEKINLIVIEIAKIIAKNVKIAKTCSIF